MKLKFPITSAARTRSARTAEEQDILKSLNEVRENIESCYHRLNYSTDALITDSLNYELLSLESRHKFYLNRAKELNLRSLCMKAEV